jgi:hypothetical protein
MSAEPGAPEELDRQEKKKIYDRAYYLSHKEKWKVYYKRPEVIARRQKYIYEKYRNDPEYRARAKERSRKSRLRPEVRAKAAQYNRSERAKQVQRAYRQKPENKEKARERDRKRYYSNPDRKAQAVLNARKSQTRHRDQINLQTRIRRLKRREEWERGLYDHIRTQIPESFDHLMRIFVFERKNRHRWMPQFRDRKDKLRFEHVIERLGSGPPPGRKLTKEEVFNLNWPLIFLEMLRLLHLEKIGWGIKPKKVKL